MAPRTRRSYMDHIRGAPNENHTFPTLGTSLEGNSKGSDINTAPLPGRYNLSFKLAFITIISTRETHLQLNGHCSTSVLRKARARCQKNLDCW